MIDTILNTPLMNGTSLGDLLSLEFLVALLGDVLTATCEEQSRTGRSGVYDATVTNQNGEIIALMRGRSRTIKGHHFEEETT